MQHATVTYYKHTILPARSQPPRVFREAGKREKKQRTLCIQTCLNMPRSGKVGASRQGGCEFTRGVGTPYILQAAFPVWPDNTVVYRKILINIPRCGIRENTSLTYIGKYAPGYWMYINAVRWVMVAFVQGNVFAVVFYIVNLFEVASKVATAQVLPPSTSSVAGSSRNPSA